jgi:Flp pilus assembly pilin Flp
VTCVTSQQPPDFPLIPAHCDFSTGITTLFGSAAAFFHGTNPALCFGQRADLAKNIVRRFYRMKQLLNRLMVEEQGQGITEYALILGFVVLGVWVGVTNTNIGQSITGVFSNVNSLVSGCVSGSCP